MKNRPQWHVIKGGSRSYIKPLIAPLKDNVRLNTPIKSVVRGNDKVTVTSATGEMDTFDHIVIAAHSDQALAMLADASEAEKDLLGAIPYQSNEVVLHTDVSLLPKRRLTWSSWNYRIVNDASGHEDTPPVLTYNMNILQSLMADETFCVTLNKKDRIDPSRILGVYHYSHPVFSVKGMAAQDKWQHINGVNRTWFCGAYWGNGFHEDGVSSALKVTEQLGLAL